MFGLIFFGMWALASAPLALRLVKMFKVIGSNANKWEDKKREPIPKIGWQWIPSAIMLLVWMFSGRVAHFATEYWWYESLERSDVFWTFILPKLRIFLIAFVSVAGVVGLYMYFAIKRRIKTQWNLYITAPISLAIGGLLALWVASEWQAILFFLHSEATGTLDPIFSRDVSYYLFELPLYMDLFAISKTLLMLLTLIGCVIYGVEQVGKKASVKDAIKNMPVLPWIFLAGVAFLHAIQSSFVAHELLYSTGGIVDGVTYTDHHVTIPVLRARYIVFGCIGALLVLFPFIASKPKWFNVLTWVAAATMFIALIVPIILGGFQVIWIVVVIISAIVLSIVLWFTKKRWNMPDEILVPSILAVTVIVVQGLVNQVIVPEAIQAVVVEPKEMRVETPYLANNIAATREAFNLTDEFLIEETVEYSDTLTREMLIDNKATVQNIRILDYNATRQIINRTQTEVQYYNFRDVDVDRYTDDGVTHMYFVGAREMDQSGLQSQSYYNQRYVYGHGYGYVKAIGSQHNVETGYPELLVKGFPMTVPGEPRVYYPENTDDGYFYVNTNQKEHDYPISDSQAKYDYTGTGGVTIGSGLRKILFGMKYDWRLVFGGAQVVEDSRIMLHRNAHERVSKLCPFITWEEDAQLVIREDGSMAWLVNGFSTSNKYPYASSYDDSQWRGEGAKFNYIRHSVKAVVDAFNGDVVFYSFYEEHDPIITALQNIFPDMFHSLDEMPEDLKSHLLYPIEYFKAQSYMHMIYHMDNPEEFYTKDKIWRVAYENYKGNRTMIEPRYMLMQLPGDTTESFTITVPFTPKELNADQTRDYLTGWMAGVCDPNDFLKLKVYKYPRGKEIFGPWMVENQINTQSQISQSFTLWSSKGSDVWQGNLITIPIDNTVISVEPLILVASNSSGKKELPTIKMVIVHHNNSIAWGRTTEEALNNLILGNSPQEMREFNDKPVVSVFDEYTVTVPSIAPDGSITSSTVRVSSMEQVKAELLKAIGQTKDLLLTLESTVQTLEDSPK